MTIQLTPRMIFVEAESPSKSISVGETIGTPLFFGKSFEPSLSSRVTLLHLPPRKFQPSRIFGLSNEAKLGTVFSWE